MKLSASEIDLLPTSLGMHWPDVEAFEDVRQIFVRCGRVDITGRSLPALLTAGKQKAQLMIATSGRQCLSLLSKRPAFVVGENVAGHITLGLDQVLFDLEGEGYTAGRLLFQLAPSMPCTEETESGSSPNMWATQQRQQLKGRAGLRHRRRQQGLEARREAVPDSTAHDNAQVRGVGKTVGTKRGTTLGGCPDWPTPQAADHKNMDTARQPMLSSEAGLWPTQLERDWKHGKISQATADKNSGRCRTMLVAP